MLLPPTLSPISNRADLKATPTVPTVQPQDLWDMNGKPQSPTAPTTESGQNILRQISAIPGKPTLWTGSFAQCQSLTIIPMIGQEVIITSDIDISYTGAVVSVGGGTTTFRNKIISNTDLTMNVDVGATLDIIELKGRYPEKINRSPTATVKKRASIYDKIDTTNLKEVYADWDSYRFNAINDGMNAQEGAAATKLKDYSGNTRDLIFINSVINDGAPRTTGYDSRGVWSSSSVTNKITTDDSWIMAMVVKWPPTDMIGLNKPRLFATSRGLADDEMTISGVISVWQDRADFLSTFIGNGDGTLKVRGPIQMNALKQIWLVSGQVDTYTIRVNGSIAGSGKLGNSQVKQSDITFISFGDDIFYNRNFGNLSVHRAAFIQGQENIFERVEGILAWDTGEPSGLLIDTHPYKAKPPTVTITDAGITYT